jgi:DNA-binding transcriptional LysR family regulator
MRTDPRDLLNFYCIVNSKGFTAAAKVMQVSKGYLSKSLHRLELMLNAKLLHRSTRQFVLTEAGEELFNTLSIMHNNLQASLENLQQLSGIPKGEIKISAPPAYAEYLLAGKFASFMEKYPGIIINLDLHSELVDVVGGGYDLVIRGAKLVDSRVIARKLVDIKNVLVASKKFIKANGAPKEPIELLNFKCAAYRNPDKIVWRFKNGRSKQDIAIKPQLSSNLSSMLKACVLADFGIASLPLFMVEEELGRNKLQLVLRDWQLEDTPGYLLYPARDYMPLKTRLLVDYLCDTCAKHK